MKYTAKIKAQITSLGFTDKEAEVYLAALEMGQFSITSLSHRSGVKRPTCYLIIDSLMKRGFITQIPRAKKMLYSAESPDQIKKEIDAKSKQIDRLLPELQRIRKSGSEDAMVKFYRGEQGIEAIYSAVLKDRPKATYAMMNMDECLSVIDNDFLADWIKNRVKLGIKAHIIETGKAYSPLDPKKFGDSVSGLREVRHFPGSMPIPGEIIAYHPNKVAFISTKKDDFSFIVTSVEFYKTIKTVFDLLWSLAPEK